MVVGLEQRRRHERKGGAPWPSSMSTKKTSCRSSTLRRDTTVKPYAVNTKDASKMTGIPVATLTTWRSRGGGPPFVKAGRCVLYRVADLQAWLDARVVTSTADAIARGMTSDGDPA